MNIHPDQHSYSRYMSRPIAEQATNSLAGLLQGISIDHQINPTEMQFLNQWINEHSPFAGYFPFTELLPKVIAAVADGVLTVDERDDVLWLCDRLREGNYYDQVTANLQKLHGIVGGIAADRRINEVELRGLSTWLADNDHLKSLWPYDEIESLVTGVLADKQISDEEQANLQEFFEQFTPFMDDRTIVDPLIEKNGSLVGLCAVCPDIYFDNSIFCFTGSSHRHTRDALEAQVRELGGQVSRSVTQKLRYLVIGAAGNPCWAYACYGRKVEQAVQLRKAGYPLIIIHENDFHDAVADAG
jgi:NAD-dependent DNA ligase